MSDTGICSKIGLVGLGTMGLDLSICFAAYGYKVIAKEINQNTVDNFVTNVKNNYRLYQLLNPAFRKVELNTVLNNIQVNGDYTGFDEVIAVIESVTEDAALKGVIFTEVSQIAPQAMFYASNTSCVSITQIASRCASPDKVVGLHFMNPVPVKQAVEAVRGMLTSKEVENQATEILKTIDKSPIWVNDNPGFVANRLSHLFMNEAAFLIQDNIATAEEIDRIFKNGYGHAMGPLETADLIGLDVVEKSLEVLYNSYQDPKYRCCPLLKRMVYAGRLGKKSGRGFYEYN